MTLEKQILNLNTIQPGDAKIQEKQILNPKKQKTTYITQRCKNTKITLKDPQMRQPKNINDSLAD